MIDRLIATVRRVLPIGNESERMKWRSEMHAQRAASEQEIARLQDERPPRVNLLHDRLTVPREGERHE